MQKGINMMALAAAFGIIICYPMIEVEGFSPDRERLPSAFSVALQYAPQKSQREGVILNAAPDGMHWFVKTEQFCKPFPVVKPHLEAHRAWVRSLREQNDSGNQPTIVSGYRVDAEDRPGGGGLMIFAAKDYAAAEELVRNDPLIANECVDWQLNKWIAETGDINLE
mmetsp:Transcript_12439/g.26473  ORF Transcript_12439/g.26473 Transcript_12439/m.26473 type:complete len:167 (+) Transcript_12439:118-618(+)